jgi:hypothetical protein
MIGAAADKTNGSRKSGELIQPQLKMPFSPILRGIFRRELPKRDVVRIPG